MLSSARSRRQIESPSSPGSIRSSISRSGRIRCSRASIALPLSAHSTSNPSRRMKSASSRLISGSSSTIRSEARARSHGRILDRADAAQGRQRAVVTHCYTPSTKTISAVSPGRYPADTIARSLLAWLPQRQPSPVKETATMKKLIAMSTLAGALSIAAVADASAWTRSGTSTGPRGTSSVQARAAAPTAPARAR